MYLTDENSSQDWNEAEDPSDPSTHASANPASIKNPLLPGGAVTSSLKKKAQGLSLKIPKHWNVIVLWRVCTMCEASKQTKVGIEKGSDRSWDPHIWSERRETYLFTAFIESEL